MATIRVYVNENGGSPKMWMYADTPGGDQIAFGSCFKGHQVQTKSRGYGSTTASQKQRDGYTYCGSFTSTTVFSKTADTFWNDLKQATNNNRIVTEPDRTTVLKAALQAARQNSSVGNVKSTSDPTPPPKPTPKPAPPKAAPAITSVLKDDAKAAASPYDW